MALSAGRVGVNPDQVDMFGRVKRSGGGASELSELSDVNLSSPSNGQILRYNSSRRKWENSNESGGDIPSMQEIIAAVKQSIYADAPFLDGVWKKLHITCDGSEYTIVENGNIDVYFANAILMFPEDVYIAGYFQGFNTFASSSSTKPTLDVEFRCRTTSGKCGLVLPGNTVQFDIYIWVLLKDRPVSISNELRSTNIKDE